MNIKRKIFNEKESNMSNSYSIKLNWLLKKVSDCFQYLNYKFFLRNILFEKEKDTTRTFTCSVAKCVVNIKIQTEAYDSAIIDEHR